MHSQAKTVTAYLAELPDDRKQMVAAIRDRINKDLPKGFQEGIGYGMIAWSVPHSIYPKGYHVDPKLPLMMMSLASQKNHVSFYHMALYEGSLLEWFLKEWAVFSKKKPDMGKCCLRFKKMEDVPLELIGKLAAKMTPEQWVGAYEKALDSKRV
jgi:hypothetical protein